MPRSFTSFVRAQKTRVIVGAALGLLAVAVPAAQTAHAETTTVTSSVPAAPTGLDRTGATIPKTNYPIPAGAIFMSPQGNDNNAGTQAAPVLTINKAVKLATDGGTIVLRGGDYRDWFHDSKIITNYGFVAKSLTLQAYPGESPWFNGSDIIATSAWTKVADQTQYTMPWSTANFCDGLYYSRPLTEQSIKPNTGPCAHFDMSKDPSNLMAADPQMVFVDGKGLKQVTSQAKVDATSFYYDWTNKKMVIGVDPAGKTVEASSRPIAMIFSKGNSKVLGIGFRKFATNEYHNLTANALYFGGSKSLVENSVFTLNAAAGLGYSNPQPGSTVTRTVFAYNGYSPLGGNGTSVNGTRNDFTLSDSIFYRNNTELFGTDCTISCGQAAAKFAHMVGLTLTNNLVEETRGVSAGLWCDLDCSDTKITYNTIKNNPGSGIFYEVSNKGIIAGNVISGSTFGISVASANTKVYNNTLVDNVQGINIYDDQRTKGVDGWSDVGPDTRGIEVVNNVVSGKNYSLKASAMRINPVAPNTVPDDFFTKVEHNVYYQSNGTAPIYVSWRARDGKESLYRTPLAASTERNIEAKSTFLAGTTDPLFVDKASADLRIRPGSSAYESASDLPSDVAAALGVQLQSATRSSGALARS